MKNPHKALEAIEILVGGDLGFELEWWLTDKDHKANLELLEAAAETILKIYEIAHSEVADCHHEDWEKVKYEILAPETP